MQKHCIRLTDATRLLHHYLGDRLVHRRRRRHRVRSDERKSRDLQKSLHPSIFAVSAVKHREHHIDSQFPGRTIRFPNQQSPEVPIQTNRYFTVSRILLPGAVTDTNSRGTCQKPVPLFRDTHCIYLILVLADVGEDRRSRYSRNLMFRGDSAEQNQYFRLILHIAPLFNTDLSSQRSAC